MSRKYHWSKEKYIEVVRGNRAENIEGLRSIAYGFDAADGFNLAHFDQWTKSQRAKVRDYFHRVELLQGQPKRIVRARGATLDKLQDAFHGGIPGKFKVAYIPDTQPQTTLPGAKKNPPKLRILADGVSVVRNEYERIFIPFDQKALVTNARKEVKRVASKMPGAALYFVQVGEYQNLTGMSIGLITETILKWMEQYDGEKELPATSGNKGDDPRHHHWRYWLNGLVGYVLPRHVDIRRLGRIIYEGRQKAQDASRNRKNYMRRIRLRRKK